MGQGNRRWEFLKSFPFLITVQICLIAMMCGIFLANWFIAKFHPIEDVEWIFATVCTIGLSTVVIAITSYHTFSGMTDRAADKVTLTNGLGREIAVLAPLVVGSILTFYLIATNNIELIGKILWPAIILWAVLRLVFLRRRRWG